MSIKLRFRHGRVRWRLRVEPCRRSCIPSTAQSQRYASVKDFQDAIRQFRSHAESIALATRAQNDLETAEKSGEYQVFSRAVFAFEEAIGATVLVIATVG